MFSRFLVKFDLILPISGHIRYLSDFFLCGVSFPRRFYVQQQMSLGKETFWSADELDEMAPSASHTAANESRTAGQKWALRTYTFNSPKENHLPL